MMDYFNEVKKILDIKIEDELLIAVVFEISRYFDKQFTTNIKQIQQLNNIKIDTPNRKKLRKKFYYGKFSDINTIADIDGFKYTEYDVTIAFKDCYERLNTYDKSKIVESMKKRVQDLKNNILSKEISKEWLEYYEERQKKWKYSFTAIRLNQDYFTKMKFNENILIDFIRNIYDDLENYRYLAIVVEGEIYNLQNEVITWNLLYKAGIYAENFAQYRDRFSPFHKDKQISELCTFLEHKGIMNAKKISSEFYEMISTGFKFEDCYISDNQSYKVLILKKIQLDNTNVPCPSCNTIIQSGNSYPEVFLKSWECKNPSCTDRSKSGRGKRFDEYSVYRYFKLVENNKKNIVDDITYRNFRRDIFKSDCDYTELLIKKYTYSNETILMNNICIKNNFGRNIANDYEIKLENNKNYVRTFENLPIVRLFKGIVTNLNLENGNTNLSKTLEVFHGNSVDVLQKFKSGQIGAAMTSPPYYNAREYSQWKTLIMYLVDMMINCKTVYNTLSDGGYYLYNIGDIVSEDNVYIKSNMSKRRIPLGFLSSMIFEIAGYNLTGNIIWDKGEVQSKRSSTVNLFSGYVKCINCYEHLLVFRKGKFEKISNKVLCLSPVIKINSKGENTYKHTAPYPLDLVCLIKPYLKSNLYLLDPFLGSGTTLKWCKLNNCKGVGIELNNEYYSLCLNNLD